MPDHYLKIREVAEILGVTPLTLRNWDRKGLLVAGRNPFNNYRVYRYSDVADLITQIQERGPQPAAEPQRLAVKFIDEAEEGVGLA